MTKAVSSYIDTVNQNSQQGYYTHIISDFSCPLRHFVRAFKHTFEQNRLKCNKCSKKWLNVEFRWIGKKRELLSRWWWWWCREWTWFQEPINGNVRVCVCVCMECILYVVHLKLWIEDLLNKMQGFFMLTLWKLTSKNWFLFSFVSSGFCAD